MFYALYFTLYILDSLHSFLLSVTNSNPRNSKAPFDIFKLTVFPTQIPATATIINKRNFSQQSITFHISSTHLPGHSSVLLLVMLSPVPMAARSEASFCGHWFAGFVGSNPSGGMNVSLLQVLCVVR